MKSIEELTLKTSNIDAWIDEIIIKKLEEYKEAKFITKSLMRTRRLPDNAGDSIVIGYGTTLNASDVSEAGTVTYRDLSLTAATLSLEKKFATGIRLTSEAMSEAYLPVLEESLRAAATGVARASDEYNWTKLLGKTLVTGATITSGGSTHDLGALGYEPLLTAPDQIGGADVGTIDYFNGIAITASSVASGSTIDDFYYSNAYPANTMDVASPSTLAYADIVGSRVMGLDDYEELKVLVMHSRALGQILKSSDFVRASDFGDKVLVGGEVGKVSGIRVIVNNSIPNSVAIMIDPARYAEMIDKKMYSHRRMDEDTDILKVSFWYPVGSGVINKNAAVLITNLASDAASLA